MRTNILVTILLGVMATGCAGVQRVEVKTKNLSPAAAMTVHNIFNGEELCQGDVRLQKRSAKVSVSSPRESKVRSRTHELTECN